MVHDIKYRAYIYETYHFHWGTWYGSWLRHCATSQKVAGSIPDEVIGFLIYLFLQPHYGPGID
jgi:hypothetical protein